MKVAAALAVLGACTSTSAPAPPPTPPGNVRLAIAAADGGRHAVRAEVAADDASRARGLMFRTSLSDDAGMLFIFPEPGQHTFWMKNVPIPLDMIFVGDDLRIVGIVESAAPQTTDGRSIPLPSRYVLEVGGGWCGRRGVKTGDRLELIDPPPAPR